ncbi:phosphatidylethanolamine-binding protein [Schizophyllum amplum]|uniref:Phosphatidylethanolamine-binding protein n=1 Tax=Schizophyllum amplum TaxID=97359 RepID=A0A550D041_9AGAR|nr:phosphatidylethanolamine-binding protein [Auriculariopsis ampla]
MQLFNLLATFCTALFAAQSQLDSVRDAFYDAKIVPDVLPSFDPTLEIYVEFLKASVIKPGAELSMNQTDTFPQFVLKSSRQTDMLKKYVVTMVDPDAYYPSDPSVSQVRHYLGANLTVDGVGRFWTTPITNLTGPVTDWMPPSPPDDSDPHRYVVLVYQQPPDFTLDGIKPPDFTLDGIKPHLNSTSDRMHFNATSDRMHFNISSFASAVGLRGPVGGTYFLTGADSGAVVGR